VAQNGILIDGNHRTFVFLLRLVNIKVSCRARSIVHDVLLCSDTGGVILGRLFDVKDRRNVELEFEDSCN
jgi:hypothetical protein